MVELKAELTKLGIAPGKRKKAELIDLLHAAVKESQQSSSTQENDQHVAAVFNAEETDPDKIVESQQETTVAQEPSAGTGRPRRIKFLDISSLDEEQQVLFLAAMFIDARAEETHELGVCYTCSHRYM